MFRRLGGKLPTKWEEVVAISVSRSEEIKKEARQLGVLLDKEIWAAMEANNMGILRYVVNRLTRIKRCLDSQTLEQVKRGYGKATERAMRKLLLYNWEGPIVKFWMRKRRRRLLNGRKSLITL